MRRRIVEGYCKPKPKKEEEEKLIIGIKELPETVYNIRRSIDNMFSFEEVSETAYEENLTNEIKCTQSLAFKNAEKTVKRAYAEGIYSAKKCADYASEHNLHELTKKIFDSQRPKYGEIFIERYFGKVLHQAPDANKNPGF